MVTDLIFAFSPMEMKKEKPTLKGIWKVLKNSITGFSDHKVTKLSGSLAYYTVFSMAPLLVVIISLCGIFLGQEAAQGEIYKQLAGFMGKETALQLQNIVEKAAIGNKGTIAFIIGNRNLTHRCNFCFCRYSGLYKQHLGIETKAQKRLVKDASKSFFILFCYH